MVNPSRALAFKNPSVGSWRVAIQGQSLIRWWLFLYSFRLGPYDQEIAEAATLKQELGI